MADRRPSRRLWLAAVLAVGCARFQPVTPLHAQSGDVDLVLDSVQLGRLGQIRIAAHSTDAHALSQAWFTVATRSPCSGGAEVNDIRVDGTPMAVLPPGDHQLSVWPTSGSLSFDLDTVVDIQSDADCLRVPVVSQSIPLAAPNRPTVVIADEVLFTPMPSGLRALLGLEVGLARWFGPVQLSAEAGFAVAICEEVTCGRDAQNNLRDGAGIPMSLGARYAFGMATIRGFANIGYLEARYLLTPHTLPLPSGSQWLTAQSGFVALGWGFLDLPPGPFRHLERAAQMEFSVPLGVTVESAAGSRRAAFSGGLALRFLLPL